MGFASSYLEARGIFSELIKEAPDEDTGIIVVIPAYNEPGICEVLDSLKVCDQPDCHVEVIIIVNAPSNASESSLKNNSLTIKNIESWKIKNSNCFFRLFVFMAGQPPIKGWGVGLARKTGMDEAVRRFNRINNPGGVILSLDADCLVSKNYLVSVSDELLKKKEHTACSIYFEHPLSGTEFKQNIYESIALYELHLRYYYQGLAYSGFPYVFHTVGSAVAVKALSYVKAGGMNRRQAGEDFYFIQKLVPSGGYFNLNTTTVYPSPRASFRVPFGTGASIGKLTEENCTTLQTYNLLAFKELRGLFERAEESYNRSSQHLSENHKLLPLAVQLFIDKNEWIEKISEINNNTSGSLSFRKRFFEWFNMFKIVKYLNFSHNEFFEKKAVEVSALELLREIGADAGINGTQELLDYFRSMEKE
jgi:hypothetical protein